MFLDFSRRHTVQPANQIRQTITTKTTLLMISKYINTYNFVRNIKIYV